MKPPIIVVSGRVVSSSMIDSGTEVRQKPFSSVHFTFFVLHASVKFDMNREICFGWYKTRVEVHPFQLIQKVQLLIIFLLLFFPCSLLKIMKPESLIRTHVSLDLHEDLGIYPSAFDVLSVRQ